MAPNATSWRTLQPAWPGRLLPGHLRQVQSATPRCTVSRQKDAGSAPSLVTAAWQAARFQAGAHEADLLEGHGPPPAPDQDWVQRRYAGCPQPAAGSCLASMARSRRIPQAPMALSRSQSGQGCLQCSWVVHPSPAFSETPWPGQLAPSLPAGPSPVQAAEGTLAWILFPSLLQPGLQPGSSWLGFGLSGPTLRRRHSHGSGTSVRGPPRHGRGILALWDARAAQPVQAPRAAGWRLIRHCRASGGLDTSRSWALAPAQALARVTPAPRPPALAGARRPRRNQARIRLAVWL